MLQWWLQWFTTNYNYLQSNYNSIYNQLQWHLQCFKIQFTGRLPMFRLVMTWNRPHWGMPGMIVMIVPFFLFFFFLSTYCFLQGNCPHSGSQWCGTVPTKVCQAWLLQSCPFFFFQILTVFLQENNPWSGLWWCGTVPIKVCWARSLWSCPFSLFSYLFILNTMVWHG